jgi:hypothetical protein
VTGRMPMEQSSICRNNKIQRQRYEISVGFPRPFQSSFGFEDRELVHRHEVSVYPFGRILTSKLKSDFQVSSQNIDALLFQEDGVAGTHFPDGQHLRINPRALAMILNDAFQNFRARFARRRVEIDHHAALVDLRYGDAR